MKVIKYVLIFTLLQVVSNSNIYAFEKVGTTSFQFLKMIPSARAASMAGAYSTISIGSDAVFFNPAGLTSVSSFDGAVGYLDWFMDVAQFSFTAAYTIEGIGTFGFMGMMTDIGEIEETIVDPSGSFFTGNTFSPSSQVWGLSYAKDLNDRFTFGINVKYAYENLFPGGNENFEDTETYDKGAWIFDGGMTFKTGYKSIVVGASIRNFGQELTYIDKNYPLPQTLNIGVSSYLFSNDDPLISKTENHSLLLSADIIQPRDYDQQYALGAEYSFSDMLFLRGGYLFNSDNGGLNFGAGITFKGTTLDYAYSDYGEYLGAINRISISVSLK